MLTQLKLQVKQAPRCTKCPEFSGRLGAVYLSDVILEVHEACYTYGQFVADVQIRTAGSVAVASVNQWEVHPDILRAVLEASKDAQAACLTLAELHITKVLSEGLYR